MVTAVLAEGEFIPTPQLIREHISKVRALFHSISDDEAERLAKSLETIHNVTMSLGSVLKEAQFEPWLDQAKVSIDPFYWTRYKQLLSSASYSAQVLASLDTVSDRVLGLLGDPSREGNWDRRGMVVGHVQSGKTANYIGLMCKAADAGYKVIIVIAGIHNNLRNQTQARVDEGFVGFDSAKGPVTPGFDGRIGVAKFASSRRPATFTNTLKDFNTQTARAVAVPLVNLTEPAVFVIKKNTHTLRNLLNWLKAHNARRGMTTVSEPMLLIDDEADNASINISKGRDEVSRINGQIRAILKSFDRSTYVGYTATPFANIFVDPEDEDEMVGQDLFPRDFVVSLDPPKNYFGPERVFGSEGASTPVRRIADNEDWLPIKHKIDHVVLGLPPSLKSAIRDFLLARAIRLVRGHSGAHNSMLVNVSRFNNVQRQVKNEIHAFLENVKSSIRVNGTLASPKHSDPEIVSLRDSFSEYKKMGVSETWDSIAEVLHEAASPIKVIEVNSKSPDSLDYGEHTSGLNVIAVGGFSLSRGLTLEGLVTSYFLRNSMMYDTLMQMGRWFGYRPGYEDLCRIWMPEVAEGWYSHIAESVEELREEFRRMEAVNATPKDFGLKVRSHPDTLVVTARNKMGTGTHFTVSIGLANEFVETTVVYRNEERRIGNYNAAIGLAEDLRSCRLAPEEGEHVFGGRLVRDVPVQVVMDFLSAFENHPGSILSDPKPIRHYIHRRANSELRNWDILFPGIRNPVPFSLRDSGLGFELVCQRRAPGERGTGSVLHIGSRRRVASRGVERAGLTPIEIENAEREFKRTNSEKRNVSDKAYRTMRKKPLLIVHLLGIGNEGADLRKASPHVAWSISFPASSIDEGKVGYVVNSQWLVEQVGELDLDDDADGDDE